MCERRLFKSAHAKRNFWGGNQITFSFRRKQNIDLESVPICSNGCAVAHVCCSIVPIISKHRKHNEGQWNLRGPADRRPSIRATNTGVVVTTSVGILLLISVGFAMMRGAGTESI